MKLSKSLSILSWVYMGLALFILLVVAKLLPVNAQLATRTLQIDMVIFLVGALLNHLSNYFKRKEYERILYSKPRKERESLREKYRAMLQHDESEDEPVPFN